MPAPSLSPSGHKDVSSKPSPDAQSQGQGEGKDDGEGPIVEFIALYQMDESVFEHSALYGKVSGPKWQWCLMQ